MLLPTWACAGPGRPLAGDFVNNARSIDCYDIYRQTWPDGRFIYCTRDPRDQILTVTYRKQAYRMIAAPNASDEEYLVYNAKRYMSIYTHYRRAKSDRIYFVKYESLKKQTLAELQKMSSVLELIASNDELAQVVFDHNADNMRAGLVPWQGNLGKERPRSWREVMTERQKALCRPIIQGALAELGYESCENW